MIPAAKRHSLEQKKWVEARALQMLDSELFPRSHGYLILAELAQHGSPMFGQLCERLAAMDAGHKMASSRRGVLTADHGAAVEFLSHSGVRLSASLERALLHPTRPVFIPSPDTSSPLIVVFTTAFNNFYYSNPVTGALLTQKGFACLFLKDASGYQYLKGIGGLGKDWNGSIDNLRAFLREHGRGRRIVCAGFSSSGFAALLAAEGVGADHAVGFSIRSTMSLGSPLPRSKLITDEMYEGIPIELQVDLEPVLRGTKMPVNLYCGEESPYDIEHTMALSGLSNVTHRVLPETGHISIRPFVKEGKLAQAMAASVDSR